MILGDIVVRDASIGDKPRTELDELRQQIDMLDKQLIEIVSKRMSISEKIAKYKYENGITVLQARRYDEILASRRAIAEQSR